MKLEDLTENWEYKPDSRGGYWKVLEPNRHGKYRGDCEDFALTALFILSDGSWKTFWKEIIFGDAKLQRVKSPAGGNHVVLEYGNLYIDNWAKKFQNKNELKALGYKFFTRRHLWFVTVQKLAWSKLLRKW